MNEGSTPQEQLESCLKNIFDVPTKNIESAFKLVLDLIKDQSTQLNDLRKAHDEALEDNGRVQVSLQKSVDDLCKEKHQLQVDLKNLKKEYGNLLDSQNRTKSVVEELAHEVEVCTYSMLFICKSYSKTNNLFCNIVQRSRR